MSGPDRMWGNMDVQEVCATATVYQPINVTGALLHVGDVHAIQGDGEINCAGGIECRAEVTLTVEIEPKPKRMSWPRIVNDTHLIPSVVHARQKTRFVLQLSSSFIA
jgi:amidase